MLTPIHKNSKGLVMVTGPTKSGKSELAEFFLTGHQYVTYVATSINRKTDHEWNKRIRNHRQRRPSHWKLIEAPLDICKIISSVSTNDSLLVDSIGGLVEQHLNYSTEEWESYSKKLIECLSDKQRLIVVVSEEVGWGVVPSTSIGHLFRERLSTFSSLLAKNSNKKWLAIKGSAIDLDQIGNEIP